jgi:Mycothiol maleylpyruvate isomerase N-terminal domain
MDRPEVRRNAASRERLRDLVARLGEAELAHRLDGWTVAAVLAHLAFWDRLALARWRQVERGLEFQHIDAELVNEAALAQWLAVPGREAAQQALAAAEALDREIVGLAPELIEAMLGQGLDRMVDRSEHRREHLDQIKRGLGH